MHKKRYTHKLGAMQWGWMLAGGAVIISCLLLVAIATSQGQAPSSDATTHPLVTGTKTAKSISSEIPNTFVTANAQQMTGVLSLSAGGPI
ncbi:MAG TPA: hypothetical protein VGN15_07815, partial [Ktedonobacteraceae bacterium]|nr:hypothetical protein [Ktedonobacteraceae bacterium]